MRQVRALTNATQRLAKGDWSARTGLKAAEGEIGQLAKTFDDMASALQRRNHDRESAERLTLFRALQQTVVAALGQFALTHSDLPSLMNQAVIFIAQTLEVEYSAVLEMLTDGQLFLRAGVGWKPGCVGNCLLYTSRCV